MNRFVSASAFFLGLTMAFADVRASSDDWRAQLPRPVFDENPEYVDFYYRAWEIAHTRIDTIPGLPAPRYMDEAHRSDRVWIWDTCFMVHFCKYCPGEFPGIESLENFYGIMLADDARPLPTVKGNCWCGENEGKTLDFRIHHPDNPPLFAWTEYVHALQAGDRARLEKVYSEERWLQRWYDLFENFDPMTSLPHGAASKVMAKKESNGYRWGGCPSGMDNTPRGRTGANDLGHEAGCPNNPDLLWVDAIAQQGLSALCLSRIAALLGDAEGEKAWRSRYEAIKAKVNDLYWDEADGIYYDILNSTGAKVKVPTAASYWPLLAEMAPQDRAARLLALLMDDRKFGGPMPVPSVARDDADFHADGAYWRGSMWLPTAYMAVKAADAYGDYATARQVSRRIVDGMNRTYREFEPHTIWECYSPTEPKPAKNKRGKCVRSDFCGWSALGPISLFVEDVIGVKEANAFANTLVCDFEKNPKGRVGVENYRFGKVICTVVATAEKVSVRSNLPFELVFDGVVHHVMAGENSFVRAAVLQCPAVNLGGDWQVAGEGFVGVARLPGTLAEAGLGSKQDYATWEKLTDRVEKGALRLSYVYRGKAVWTRTVVVPEELADKDLEVFLERVLWSSELKVDGKSVGRCDSLGTPHIYRLAPGTLTPGPHEFTLEIDNASHYGFTGKSHGWGWSTQTCWNGVIGRFELRERNPLDEAQVFAPYPAKEMEVAFSGAGLDVRIDGLALKGWRCGDRYRFALPFAPKPWSAESPRLYTVTLFAAGKTREVRIGFRTLARRGNRLYLNGVPLWIRGDVDNCQFPLTGYPAMTPAEWRRQIRIQQENGINAMRFHSWTPPDAAFQAADELGFYLFSETGYWADATIPASNIGRGNAALDDFCRRELFAVAETYGNHASFVGISVGNELGKCDFAMMDGWMKELKARDPRRLTMVSTARQVVESDDTMVTHFYPGVGPVRCRFRPGTDWDYEDVYAKTKVPTVAHEIGQWPVYPLWTEIAKYDGLLKPFDWEAMRRTAAANGTVRFNRQYHVASLKTNRFMYKDEVEGYLRTPSCAGVQLLDVRDYTGQGEALVGWLDAFFDAKAGVSELMPFSSVLRPVAFLARVPKFVLTADERFRAELSIRNLSETPVPAGARYPYSFAGETGWVELPRAVAPGEFSDSFRVTFRLDGSMVARRQELRFGENRWSVFVMEAGTKVAVPENVTMTDDPDVAAQALGRGGRVVYTGRSVGAVRGRFVPVYWSTAYFPVYDPCPMLGTWFDEDHPAFARFPTEDWMDRQWRTLTDGAFVHEPKGLPEEFRPIAMPVPDLHLSRPYATLFEVRVGEGRLLVCGYPIDRADDAESRQLRRSVFAYVASEAFLPKTAASPDWFASFACRKRPEDIDEDDWRIERCADGSVRLTVSRPPRKAGEYTVLFKEDAVVTATCEGRPCGTFSAIPVAMAIGPVTENDAADGRIEFVFTSATDVPPVASVSFRIPEEAPQL